MTPVFTGIIDGKRNRSSRKGDLRIANSDLSPSKNESPKSKNLVAKSGIEHTPFAIGGVSGHF